MKLQLNSFLDENPFLPPRLGSTLLPPLDYDDLLFMNAPGQWLKRLDTGYHCASHLITSCWNLSHHWTLNAAAQLTSIWLLQCFFFFNINLSTGWFLRISVHPCVGEYGMHNVLLILVSIVRTQLPLHSGLRYRWPWDYPNWLLQENLSLFQSILNQSIFPMLEHWDFGIFEPGRL